MKTFKWTVEIEVDETWVADGFDLDDERASEMARKELPWSRSDEVKAKVLKAPDRVTILKTQGYSDEVIQKLI